MRPKERAMLSIGRTSGALRRLTHAMARAAGVRDPEIRWREAEEATFENQLATLKLDGRHASLTFECVWPGDGRNPQLENTLERRLA
jgi:hypothetical protein